jgi:hypothetical protein
LAARMDDNGVLIGSVYAQSVSRVNSLLSFLGWRSTASGPGHGVQDRSLSGSWWDPLLLVPVAKLATVRCWFRMESLSCEVRCLNLGQGVLSFLASDAPGLMVSLARGALPLRFIGLVGTVPGHMLLSAIAACCC